MIKNCDNVEEIIQSNIENRNRMASVYKYTNKFDIMDCKLVDNVAVSAGKSMLMSFLIILMIIRKLKIACSKKNGSLFCSIFPKTMCRNGLLKTFLEICK